MKVQSFLKNNKIVLLKSMGEYSSVYTDSGENRTVSYTKTHLERKGFINLKMVRRGVYACEMSAEKNGDFIKILNKQYKLSRRMKKLWILLLIIPFFGIAQNIAPVAVNDTIMTCIDEPYTYFTVTSNDFDPNGDRIRLNSFTDPGSGELVSASNTGMFRYTWNLNNTSVNFSYTIRDLRFGNINTLVSNVANVKLDGSPKYFYNGNYIVNTSRITCLSKNSGATTISGTTREINEAYQYILLDAAVGVVEITPSAGGVVEFKIKK